jgi:hypothetical protein
MRFAAGLFDEGFVLRRAARVFAGFDDHLAGWSEAALAVAYGVFHQFGHRQIAMNRRDAVEADSGQVVGELLRGIR